MAIKDGKLSFSENGEVTRYTQFVYPPIERDAGFCLRRRPNLVTRSAALQSIIREQVNDSVK